MGRLGCLAQEAQPSALGDALSGGIGSGREVQEGGGSVYT